MKKQLTLLLLLLFSALVTYAQKSPKIKGWKTIKTKEYTMRYPESMTYMKLDIPMAQFALLAPKTSDDDSFAENINLVIQDLAGKNMTLDAYIDITIAQIGIYVQDGNVLENEKVVTSRWPYYRISYTGIKEYTRLKWLQYIYMHNEKAYVLTLTCQENEFDNYRALGEKVMQSFRLK